MLERQLELAWSTFDPTAPQFCELSAKLIQIEALVNHLRSLVYPNHFRHIAARQQDEASIRVAFNSPGSVQQPNKRVVTSSPSPLLADDSREDGIKFMNANLYQNLVESQVHSSDRGTTTHLEPQTRSVAPLGATDRLNFHASEDWIRRGRSEDEFQFVGAANGSLPNALAHQFWHPSEIEQERIPSFELEPSFGSSERRWHEKWSPNMSQELYGTCPSVGLDSDLIGNSSRQMLSATRSVSQNLFPSPWTAASSVWPQATNHDGVGSSWHHQLDSSSYNGELERWSQDEQDNLKSAPNQLTQSVARRQFRVATKFELATDPRASQDTPAASSGSMADYISTPRRYFRPLRLAEEQQLGSLEMDATIEPPIQIIATHHTSRTLNITSNWRLLEPQSRQLNKIELKANEVESWKSTESTQPATTETQVQTIEAASTTTSISRPASSSRRSLRRSKPVEVRTPSESEIEGIQSVECKPTSEGDARGNEEQDSKIVEVNEARRPQKELSDSCESLLRLASFESQLSQLDQLRMLSRFEREASESVFRLHQLEDSGAIQRRYDELEAQRRAPNSATIMHQQRQQEQCNSTNSDKELEACMTSSESCGDLRRLYAKFDATPSDHRDCGSCESIEGEQKAYGNQSVQLAPSNHSSYKNSSSDVSEGSQKQVQPRDELEQSQVQREQPKGTTDTTNQSDGMKPADSSGHSANSPVGWTRNEQSNSVSSQIEVACGRTLEPAEITSLNEILDTANVQITQLLVSRSTQTSFEEQCKWQDEMVDQKQQQQHQDQDAQSSERSLEQSVELSDELSQQERQQQEDSSEPQNSDVIEKHTRAQSSASTNATDEDEASILGSITQSLFNIFQSTPASPTQQSSRQPPRPKSSLLSFADPTSIFNRASVKGTSSQFNGFGWFNVSSSMPSNQQTSGSSGGLTKFLNTIPNPLAGFSQSRPQTQVQSPTPVMSQTSQAADSSQSSQSSKLQQQRLFMPTGLGPVDELKVYETKASEVVDSSTDVASQRRSQLRESFRRSKMMPQQQRLNASDQNEENPSELDPQPQPQSQSHQHLAPKQYNPSGLNRTGSFSGDSGFSETLPLRKPTIPLGSAGMTPNESANTEGLSEETRLMAARFENRFGSALMKRALNERRLDSEDTELDELNDWKTTLGDISEPLGSNNKQKLGLLGRKSTLHEQDSRTKWLVAAVSNFPTTKLYLSAYLSSRVAFFSGSFICSHG